MWQRQTYSLLDLLGDLGGLFECLMFIGWAIVNPLKVHALKVFLMVSLYRQKEGADVKAINKNFLTKIEPKSYLSLYIVGCFHKRARALKYKQLLHESETKTKRKLDIRRLIRDQLYLKAALRVLLSKSQMKLVK